MEKNKQRMCLGTFFFMYKNIVGNLHKNSSLYLKKQKDFPEKQKDFVWKFRHNH